MVTQITARLILTLFIFLNSLHQLGMKSVIVHILVRRFWVFEDKINIPCLASTLLLKEESISATAAIPISGCWLIWSCVSFFCAKAALRIAIFSCLCRKRKKEYRAILRSYWRTISLGTGVTVWTIEIDAISMHCKVVVIACRGVDGFLNPAGGWQKSKGHNLPPLVWIICQISASGL